MEEKYDKIQRLVDEYFAGVFTEIELFSWVFDLLPEVEVQVFYDALPPELKEDFFIWANGFELHGTAFELRKGLEPDEKVREVVGWVQAQRQSNKYFAEIEAELIHSGYNPQLLFLLGEPDEGCICFFGDKGEIHPLLMRDEKAVRVTKYLRHMKRVFRTEAEAHAAYPLIEAERG